MEDLSFTYKDIMIIGSFIISLTAVYWRLIVSIKKLEYQIEKNRCDQNERWRHYNETHDKQDAFLNELVKNIGTLRNDISEVKGDVKSIKTHIEYLKK